MARILLVDDDIAEISAVKRVLTRAGHQAVLATNTSDALTAVAFQRPDLVIVGATCEGGHGAELTRTLADDEATADVPLVVLGQSADAAPTATQLPRPVDPAQLAEHVKAAVGEGSAAATARPRAPAPLPASAPSPADALKARASQLRQGPAAAKAPPAARPAHAPRPAAPPAAAQRPAPARTAPRAPPAAPPEPQEPLPTVDQIGDDLEAVLKRAEDAERAHAAERKARARQADRATVEAAQRAEAEELAIAQARAAREAEERARVEEHRRAEEEQRRGEEERKRAAAGRRAEEERRLAQEARRRAEEEQRRAEEERLRAEEARRQAEEEQRRAEEERARAEEESRRAAGAEQRARDEERRRAEAARRAAEEKKRAELARRKAEQEGRRAEEAEGKARAEEEARHAEEAARRQAEEAHSAEVETRRALEAEVERLRAQLTRQKKEAEQKIRSALDRAAAEEQAAEAARRRAEAQAQEEADAQVRTAIESARAEMETMRRDREEERRRRAEAEAELARLAEASDRLVAERAALADLDGAPSEEERTLRRRVQALRARPEERPAEAAERAPPEPHRAPTPEAAEELPPPARPPAELRSGHLDELPAPRLLALAAQARLGGRLDFQGDVARTLYFEGGRVVGATSAAPQERIEDVALRLGLLTRDQHRAASAAIAALPTRRAAVLLLERGYLKPGELTPLVRRRTEEVVFGVFAEEQGRYRWAAEHVPADERTALDRETRALAVEGVRRRWLAARVDAVLGGAGTLLAPAPGAAPLAEYGLSPEDRRLVQLADGLRTLDEIVAASPLDPLTSRQLLAGLVLAGALAIRVLQAGRPASASATAIDLARVRDKLDQARRADYFTILGVSRACTPHEVRDAADRMLAEFDPRRFAGQGDDDLSARVDEIRRVLQDAREVLAEDALREAYVAGLG